jgi:hypothetical protein
VWSGDGNGRRDVSTRGTRGGYHRVKRRDRRRRRYGFIAKLICDYVHIYRSDVFMIEHLNIWIVWFFPAVRVVSLGVKSQMNTYRGLLRGDLGGMEGGCKVLGGITMGTALGTGGEW